jgi:hypothetical protein
VVTLVDFVNVPPEPIAGWRGYDDFDCPRAPFESEEHLAERAKAQLRVRPNDSGVIVLCSYCRGDAAAEDQRYGVGAESGSSASARRV